MTSSHIATVRNEKKKTSQTDANPQNPRKMQVVRCGDWQDPGPAAVLSSSPESACDNRPVSGRQGSIFYPIRGGSDLCHQRWVSNVWKRAQATIRTPPPHPNPPPRADSVTVLGTVSSPGVGSVFLFENTDGVQEREQHSRFFFFFFNYSCF